MNGRNKSGKRFPAKICRFGTSILQALGLPSTGLAQDYTIADLGSNSWSYSEAHGMNGTGRVVGEYEPTNFFYVQAFLYGL